MEARGRAAERGSARVILGAAGVIDIGFELVEPDSASQQRPAAFEISGVNRNDVGGG